MQEQTASKPLVSILCRSMDRPELPAALASVNEQTYPNIELVLVDAGGKGLSHFQQEGFRYPVRHAGTGEPLNRPRAANLAMQQASGEYLLFLDEDDWIAPEHVSNLVACAQANPDYPVCYSAARNADSQGRLLDEYISVPFNPDRLRKDNYIPIHTALFASDLRDQGCHFDESLEIYEDWDFWLQCARFGDFLHLDEVTAFYRMGGESNTVIRDESLRYQPGHPIAFAREKVLGKWIGSWSGADVNRLIGEIDQTALIQDIHGQLEKANHLMEEKDQQLESLQAQKEEQTAQLIVLRQELRELQQAHDELDKGVREILASFSWRIMGPYRRVRRLLDQYLLNPLKSRVATPQSAQSNQNADNEHIKTEILVPVRNGVSCEPELTLQAWAWSSEALSEISILVDGNKMQSVPVDYAESVTGMTATLEDAQRIGFCQLLELAPGAHSVSVVVQDARGNRKAVERSVLVNDPQAQYVLWRSRQAERRKAASLQPVAQTLHLLLVYRGDEAAFHATLKSVEAQSVQNLQLSLLSVDGKLPSTVPGQFSIVSGFQDFLESIDDRQGYVIFLESGEKLATAGLARLLSSTRTNPALVYSDHDEYTGRDSYCNPVFTFEWSPDLLLSQNTLGGVFLMQSGFLKNLSIIPEIENPAWRYTLLLSLTCNLKDQVPQEKIRVPEVLWSAPVADPSVKQANEIAILRAFLVSQNLAAEISGQGPHAQYVSWKLDSTPLVSIIIPTTGNLRWLKPCLDTLIERTAYKHYEIIILDNSRGKHPEGIQYARDRQVTVLPCDEDFNWSRLNNKGVENSNGELLLFLNDDIEITEADWLEEMVRQAVRSDVGTVGSLLLYPNGSIQHAGVFLVDHGGGARHLFHRQLPGKGIYLALDQCVREVSANTGACLMMARDKFQQLQGFDESLALVGNDIDLCLRSLEAGFRNIWTPRSRLIHLESVSRRDRPIGRDEASMWKRWGDWFRAGDRCYSPNLALEKENCALAAKTGRSQAAVPGLNMIAYIRAEMGVGEAARGNAAALEASGVNFGILNYEKGNPSRMSNLSWQHREVSTPEHDISLWHINADHLPAVMAELEKAQGKSRYNIAYWAWELPEFPDRWLAAMTLVDEIWVPSTFVYEAIAPKSPVPVLVIPHVITSSNRDTGSYSREQAGIPAHSYAFLSMFDIHSIAQRKNPYGSINAFRQAFAADDDSVCLVIKINNADEATVRSVRESAGGHSNIILIENHLSRQEIDSLISVCDCFVSLHHAEGFGLAPAEAMVLGKPAILTNWSGNTQYMTSDNCMGIGYELKQLGKDYGPYEAHQYWAIPDLAQAASAMQKLAAEPDFSRSMGALARQTILSSFSAAAIGTVMRRRLETIQRRLASDSGPAQ